MSRALWVVLFLLASGCTCRRGGDRPFALTRDSFAFRNELRWEYEFGPNSEVKTRKADPPPKYSLRCFPMVRAAREFFYHAEFHPEQPRVAPEQYRELARQIVGRNSRCPAAPGARIIIPGFSNLHEFSSEFADLLQDECGGATRSFLQRGNWRMVFPVTRRKFARSALGFVQKLREGQLPIVHAYQFPNTTLNHALLLYGAEESRAAIKFSAYDPNDPSRPASLLFNRETRTFELERNRYFAGGTVRVYEVYRGAFY